LTNLLEVPRDRLSQALDATPLHLKPIVLAVRDHGCAHGIVRQGAGKFDFNDPRPTIAVLGDDLFEAKGPGAFDIASVRKLAQRCKSAFVVAGAPETTVYAAAAMSAVLAREHVVVVETRPALERAWVSALRSANPSIRILLSTPHKKERS
jgi:hypothetical protein